MGEIKILSLNCQGLGQLPKRTDVFHYLKEKQYHIYCIQDTHFTAGDDEKFIRARWGNDCYFSSFRSNARGVAILFNGNLDYKVHSSKHDPNGNFILLDITIENNKFTLICLYGPNSDEPKFF